MEHITSEIKKMIPSRPEGEFLIKGNIQMKYLNLEMEENNERDNSI